MAKACLAAGIRDPSDFEGMRLENVPEIVALGQHERSDSTIFKISTTRTTFQGEVKKHHKFVGERAMYRNITNS